MSGWNVRPEQPGDVAAIAALTKAAFRDMPFSAGNEAEIVAGLRADGDLAISLVAENLDNAVIGHIAFSPAVISDGSAGWYGLGPVSVIPLSQHAGIGTDLIEIGLLQLRDLGAAGCVVLGNPAYYARFGFAHDPALTYPGPPAEHFQCLVLAGERASGVVSYAPAFG